MRTKDVLEINQLINIKEIISLQDKADILLVYNGFKRAALIEVSCFQRTAKAKTSFRKKVLLLESILARLGLVFDIHINYPKTSRSVTRYSFVAKDAKTLTLLKTAYAKKDKQRRALAIGRLLGYPKSAVVAFARRRSIENRAIPASMRKKDNFNFLNIRFSKDWKKEIAYMYSRARIIRKMSPELYAQIINQK